MKQKKTKAKSKKKKAKPITLYSNWWIKPRYKKRMVPVLRRLAKKVEKNEPGTLMYLVHYPINDFAGVRRRMIRTTSMEAA